MAGILLEAADRMTRNPWNSECLVEAVINTANSGSPIATQQAARSAAQALAVIAAQIPSISEKAGTAEAVDGVFAWDASPSTTFDTRIQICRRAADSLRADSSFRSR